MRLFLKMKIKSLAQEAKMIRKAERHTLTKGRALLGKYNKRHKKNEPHPAAPKGVERALAWMAAHSSETEFHDEAQAALDLAYEKFWGLRQHRILVVRKASRHAHLAYGFLKGLPYNRIESSGCYTPPDFNEVERLIMKFGDEDIRVIQQRFAEWKDTALTDLHGTPLADAIAA